MQLDNDQELSYSIYTTFTLVSYCYLQLLYISYIQCIQEDKRVYSILKFIIDKFYSALTVWMHTKLVLVQNKVALKC